MKLDHIYKGIGQEYYDSKLFEVNASVNPFGSNKVTDIAYQKVERLALATYLVTNLIPEEESVKENIRISVQQLLDDVLALHKRMNMNGRSATNECITTTRKIISLLDIGYASGYISQMNIEVLKNAYGAFVSFLKTTKSDKGREEIILDESFFDQTLQTNSKRIVRENTSNGQKVILSDTSVKDTITDKQRKVLKDKTLSDTKQNINKSYKRTQSLRTQKRSTSRRIAILDIVKKSGPIHIKEIVTEMPDCSEKSIQRELAQLVKDFVLQKEGIKRWTTYSVAL